MRASGTLRRAGAGWLAVLAVGLAAAPAATAASYRVIDLGTLGGSTSAATDLNNRGDVVGWAQTASGTVHAFVYRDGRMIDIGTLGGPNSRATAISNNRAVVGTSSLAAGTSPHAFLWRANQGAMHNLGNPTPVRIGDTGAIIANGTTSRGESQAMYRSNGQWTRLPRFGYDGSIGADVNDSGTAVGTLVDDPHGSAPFEYQGGVMHVLPSVPLASETAAEAISDNGDIAGQTFDPLGIVLWTGSAWEPIPTPALFDPEIHGMNDCDQIVGAHHPTVFFEPSAFLISGGVGVDLNTLIPAGSGWHLGVANAINDSGEIAGVGRFHGVQRAFLLVPTSSGAGCM